MNLVFLLVAVPIFFFILTWAAVTAYRLLLPEKPLPRARDPVVVRRQTAAAGRQVLVGVREIQEDQRYYRATQAWAPYVYSQGRSDGFPEVWVEDLWQRRN